MIHSQALIRRRAFESIPVKLALRERVGAVSSHDFAFRLSGQKRVAWAHYSLAATASSPDECCKVEVDEHSHGGDMACKMT